MIVCSGTVFAADSELIVFDWGGYEDEMFSNSWRKVTPTYSFFSDEEACSKSTSRLT